MKVLCTVCGELFELGTGGGVVCPICIRLWKISTSHYEPTFGFILLRGNGCAVHYRSEAVG